MKLASYRDGSSDGALLVVSRNLKQAAYATAVAQNLQQVLDDWNFMAPQLQPIYDALNAGQCRHAFPFQAERCLAVLPRPVRFFQTQGWPAHQALLDEAGGTPRLPHPHACSGALLGAEDHIPEFPPERGPDFGAGLAVIAGPLPAAARAEQGRAAIRLLSLCSELLLRHPAVEADAAPTPLHGRIGTVLGPVAITPDELGPAWQAGRVHLQLQVRRNGQRLGQCDAASGMPLDLGALLAGVARLQALPAGTLLAAGTVASPAASEGGKRHWPAGFGSVAAQRAAQALMEQPSPVPWLQAGDRLEIRMTGPGGEPLFGAIRQSVGAVVPDAPASAAGVPLDQAG